MSTLSTKQVSISNSAGTQVANLTCGTSGELLVDGVDVSSFQTSLSLNGYQILPSGLIVQWGSYTASAAQDTTINLPIVFPSNVWGVWASMAERNNGTVVRAKIVSNSQIRLYGDCFYCNIVPNTAHYWLAIGS
jgi:hypothetical protein